MKNKIYKKIILLSFILLLPSFAFCQPIRIRPQESAQSLNQTQTQGIERESSVVSEVVALPDLIVESIWLNNQNYICFKLKNIGLGSPKDADFSLAKIKLSYGASIKEYNLSNIDPQKLLFKSAGIVSFTTDIELKAPTRVTAEVDSRNNISETKENNNLLSLNLMPKSLTLNREEEENKDLTVAQKIQVDKPEKPMAIDSDNKQSLVTERASTNFDVASRSDIKARLNIKVSFHPALPKIHPADTIYIRWVVNGNVNIRDRIRLVAYVPHLYDNLLAENLAIGNKYPDGTYHGEYAWKIPDNLPCIHWKIRAELMDTPFFDEVEINIERPDQININATPDFKLHLGNYAYDPNNPAAKCGCVTFTNIGGTFIGRVFVSAEISGKPETRFSAYLDFSPDNPFLKNKAIPLCTKNFDWPKDETGENECGLYIIAEVDPQNEVKEVDDRNNNLVVGTICKSIGANPRINKVIDVDTGKVHISMGSGENYGYTFTSRSNVDIVEGDLILMNIRYAIKNCSNGYHKYKVKLKYYGENNRLIEQVREVYLNPAAERFIDEKIKLKIRPRQDMYPSSHNILTIKVEPSNYSPSFNTDIKNFWFRFADNF